MQELLQRAHLLQRAALRPASLANSRLLAGKHIALLATDQVSRAAQLFDEAATALGANVARIDHCVTAMVNAGEPGETGVLLGRLYDAIECQGLPAALVAKLGSIAGVPVFDGLATDVHPTVALAASPEGSTQGLPDRKFVLQAALLAALS